MDVSQFGLKGKVALVTGANRGIGAATAIGFAKAGADVAIASRDTKGRGLPDLDSVAEKIEAEGRKVLAMPTHLGKMDQIKILVDAVVTKFGRIDILVNNAGTSGFSPVLTAEEKQWDSMMNLNLKGLFFISQMVAKIMKEHGGGKIINTASVDGFKPEYEVGIYSISKAGVIMATRVLALELAKYNIRVNGIAPGAIDTRLYEAHFVGMTAEKREEDIKAAKKRIPLGRIGDPSEIANTMIFLASDASSYITGQTFPVDGGLLI